MVLPPAAGGSVSTAAAGEHVLTAAAEEQSVRLFGVEKKKLVSPFSEVNLSTVCLELKRVDFGSQKREKCIKSI